MHISAQQQLASQLLAMHRPGQPLVVINAWDVPTARLFERAGSRAIATSSASVAWSRGYRDGEHIPRDEMLGVVAQIVRAVAVPVTADLEAAYAPTPNDVADTVRRAIAAGAVGMNLEDGISDLGRAAASSTDPSGVLYSTNAAVERVAAARAAADAAGLHFIINARTDVFLLGVGAPEDRLAHAVSRANAYRAAGADCLFVPGVRDEETIRALAGDIDGPLNVLAGPATPSVADLAALGVARISVGGASMRMALAAVARACRDALERGVLDGLMDSSVTFGELDALMTSVTSERA